MTDSTKPRPLRAGDQMHVLRSGVAIHLGGGTMASGRSVVLERGQTVTITAAMLDAARDRHGSLDGSWPAIVNDPDAQLARWGVVYLAPGPWPEDAERWEHGSPEWEIARDDARRRAFALPTETERRDALADVNARFGPAASTSKTTATYATHPTERAAAAQADRLARGIADRTR